jgi:inorganic phosphate transporter, PiT family
VDAQLVVAVLLAIGFAVTNGLHDASNAIATLVATRAATPLQAILLASVFNLLGPLFLGAAVADTIGGIVTVPADVAVEVIGAGLAAAVTWNLVTWRLGLPSSSGHALVGGLVGAAVVEGGVHAINWGGIEHWRPVGVFGILIALALSPVLGGVAALLLIRAARAVAHRATRRWRAPVGAGEWGMSAALAFSHGANDAQKSIGVIVALLLAGGRIDTLAAPTWAKIVCAAALTVGTALGGWRIIATVGRRIYRIRPDGLGGRDLRVFAAGGACLYHAGCRVVGGGDRGRPAPLAPRALVGRAQHGAGVADHPARGRGARRRGARAVAAGDVTRKRWFLPETPDVLGMLRRQMAVTIDGVDAFARWAGGDAAAAQAVRDAEHQGDVAKRELLSALREAFVTPIEPEDLFALSHGIDRILDYVTDLVKESEAMASPPDDGIATMAGLLGDALRHLDDALSKLATDGDRATASADAAIAAQRELETAYYAGMVGLLSVSDRTDRITRRELYRRSSRIGEAVVDVAERVVYAVVKQS